MEPVKKQLEVLQIMEPARDGFASVGGYLEVLSHLDNVLVRVHEDTDRASRLGLDPYRSLILFGPPGTGKTLLARALAAEMKLPILRLANLSALQSFGHSIATRFWDAISLAEQMGPLIVYVDAIDRLLPDKSGWTVDDACRREVYMVLLEWLNSRSRRGRCIMIGATNYPGRLDLAALRIGRTDWLIPMLYPEGEARREILLIHLGVRDGSAVPISLNSGQFEGILTRLVERTDYFSGADLEQLVNRSKQLALAARSDALTEEHLSQALCESGVDSDLRRSEAERFSRFMCEYEAQAACMPPMRALAPLLR